MSQYLRTADPAAHVRLACLSLMWSLLRRVLAGGGCVSSRMEWDHDVPPFPIFIGEVARAEATLTFQARRRYRRLAA
jgi:uncharacterized protein (UPF0276 family)